MSECTRCVIVILSFDATSDAFARNLWRAFLAYCLHITLRRRLYALAPGLTPCSVLEKLSALQMMDVHIPTTEGR